MSAQREFEIRNILTGHCGEWLTPDKVDEIVAEIAKAISPALVPGPSAGLHMLRSGSTSDAPLMTNERMAEIMRQIGWSSQELGRRLGVREISIRRYLQGSREVPPNLATWLEGLATLVGAYSSLPDDWHIGRKLRSLEEEC
jgi:hypothetical protein